MDSRTPKVESKTPENQCCAATVEEMCAATLGHYDDISTKACHWHNQVPQAIKFWYLEKPKLELALAAALVSKQYSEDAAAIDRDALAIATRARIVAEDQAAAAEQRARAAQNFADAHERAAIKAENDLKLERTVRLQLAGDSQLHLDRALAAEARAREAEARYELLRRLNPNQFTSLYRDNISGKGSFDDLVDAAIARGEQGREKG